MKLRISIACILFVLGCWLYLFAYPYVFQLAIEYKLSAKKNTLIHTKSPSPSTPYTPNPDFIYTIAFYDLQKGDIHLSGDIPNNLNYFSIVFYQSNTSHYAVLNKESLKGDHFSITLSNRKPTNHSKELAHIVSPTNTGTIILRYYCRDNKDAAAIAAIQKKTRLFTDKQ